MLSDRAAHPKASRGDNPNSECSGAGLPLPLSGRTDLFAIVGDPIAQAGSPTVFNTEFRRLGRHAVLVPMQVSTQDFPSFMGGARAIRNLRGIIVTTPHKTAAMQHVDALGPQAHKTRSVNVIRCQPDGSWFGENFDGMGFLSGLGNAARELTGKHVLIVGLGGAGRAIALAVAGMNVERIRLHDVKHQEAARVCGDLRKAAAGFSVETGDPDPSSFDVVVNCTPLGMSPSDPLPIDPQKLRPASLVIDLVIDPEMTPLLKAAAQKSCRVHSGRHTLNGQVSAILEFLGEGPAPRDSEIQPQTVSDE